MLYLSNESEKAPRVGVFSFMRFGRARMQVDVLADQRENHKRKYIDVVARDRKQRSPYKRPRRKLSPKAGTAVSFSSEKAVLYLFCRVRYGRSIAGLTSISQAQPGLIFTRSHRR